jgi:ATP-dependent Clp protease ATP-binding subunit ClpC
MPQFHLRAAALIQSLEGELLLAEALLFPGALCLHSAPARLRQMLARRLRELVKQLPPGNVYRHRLAELPEVREVQVAVPPIQGNLGRQTPVTLTFRYVQWLHGEEASIAYVPALGIEVLAESEKQLAEQLVPQIRSALARRKSAESLRDLVWLGQVRDLRVKPLPLKVKLPTLKQAAQKARDQDTKQKSVLKECATDLAKQSLRPIYERDEQVRRLAELLTARQPRSVLLIGPSGCGKTAIVHELARRRAQFSLARTPLWTTSGSRLVAGMSGFGMWQERCDKLVREASRTKAIVHLDNLVELIEVGKGGGNTQGIAAVLRPAIARGSLLAICECTPEQLAIIEREDPQLLEAFAQLDLAESTPEQTRAILASVAAERVQVGSPVISPAALATLDRLHRRYATYSAAPGRPLRFLRNFHEDRLRSLPSPLVGEGPGGGGGGGRPPRAATDAISPQEVTAAFSHETGLPRFMLDDSVPLDLNATRDWFRQRVIGQPEPVELVVDLIAAVKAGLNRTGKPIASLLFIGPTGVGKTEMAKALAEFLYQDPGRMIRFDMSEYANPAAVERLIGGSACSQGLLTQKVRDQPFMVVLLDEFEKAHPLLFDVLLQVLGEGRLTDGGGRVADFTNSVVIMTSNLGADSFRRQAAGFAGEAAAGESALRHFEREVKAFLRPEMFNRLDRIVPFAPLSRATIGAIARREIDRVLRRDGLRLRSVQLELDPAAIDTLAEGGYDPRYGARPLKRAIERQLVAPLAENLCRYGTDVAVTCRAEAQGEALQFEATAKPLGVKSPIAGSTAGTPLLGLLGQIVELRRQAQALQTCGVVLRLRNEIARLRHAEKQRNRKLKRRGEAQKFVFTPQQAQLLAQEDLLDRIDALAADIVALENGSLGQLYAGQSPATNSLGDRHQRLSARLRALLFELHQSQAEKRTQLVIAIYGQPLARVLELCRVYEEIIRAERGYFSSQWLKMYKPELDLSPEKVKLHPGPPHELPTLHLLARKVREEETPKKVVDVYKPPPELFYSPPDDVIGVALLVAGDRPAALLEAESGRHEFHYGASPEVCLVETHRGALANYDPPAAAGRQSSARADILLRRSYHLASEICRDPLLEQEFRLQRGTLPAVMAEVLEQYLTKRTWALLDAWN